MGLPYNRRGGKERVLVLSNTGHEFVDLRYDQSQFLPSTSSPFVSDRLSFLVRRVGAKSMEGGIVGGVGKHL